MKPIHNLQIDILKKLLFANELKFSELKPDELENSQFVFHLNKLIDEEWVRKANDHYSLTIKGKEFANRMHSEQKQMRQFPKTTTVLCGVRRVNGKKEYLIYKRLKQPFFGAQGFPTQKVWFGERIDEAARKGFFEETGLTGEPKLFAIRHYHVIFSDLKGNKQLVEDKIMYMFAFEEPKGELKGNLEGEFEWIAQRKLKTAISFPLPEFAESYRLLNRFNGKISFEEKEQFTTVF